MTQIPSSHIDSSIKKVINREINFFMKKDILLQLYFLKDIHNLLRTQPDFKNFGKWKITYFTYFGKKNLKYLQKLKKIIIKKNVLIAKLGK